MSQQPPHQPTQQEYGTTGGQTTGQQMGQQPTQQMGHQEFGTGQHGSEMGQQGMGQGTRLEDVLTNEQRMLLDDLASSIEVCEWCADQCIAMGDASMTQCIRLCEDVADIGSVTEKLLARNSIHAQELVQTFAYAAQQCADECAQHPHDHCQECASTLTRAADAAWSVLDSMQGGQTGGQFGGETSGQPMGGQPMGGQMGGQTMGPQGPM